MEKTQNFTLLGSSVEMKEESRELFESDNEVRHYNYRSTYRTSKKIEEKQILTKKYGPLKVTIYQNLLNSYTFKFMNSEGLIYYIQMRGPFCLTRVEVLKLWANLSENLPNFFEFTFKPGALGGSLYFDKYAPFISDTFDICAIGLDESEESENKIKAETREFYRSLDRISPEKILKGFALTSPNRYLIYSNEVLEASCNALILEDWDGWFGYWLKTATPGYASLYRKALNKGANLTELLDASIYLVALHHHLKGYTEDERLDLTYKTIKEMTDLVVHKALLSGKNEAFVDLPMHSGRISVYGYGVSEFLPDTINTQTLYVSTWKEGSVPPHETGPLRDFIRSEEDKKAEQNETFRNENPISGNLFKHWSWMLSEEIKSPNKEDNLDLLNQLADRAISALSTAWEDSERDFQYTIWRDKYVSEYDAKRENQERNAYCHLRNNKVYYKYINYLMKKNELDRALLICETLISYNVVDGSNIGFEKRKEKIIRKMP